LELDAESAGNAIEETHTPCVYDKKDSELRVGDIVTVRFSVRAIGQPDALYSNLTLETIEPMPGSGLRVIESYMNSKQVEKEV
jgi:hypothetical protein